MLKTVGISPKLYADLLVSVASFLMTHYAVGLDPELAAIISKLVGSLAAYIASPGDVGKIDAQIPPDQGDAGMA